MSCINIAAVNAKFWIMSSRYATRIFNSFLNEVCRGARGWQKVNFCIAYIILSFLKQISEVAICSPPNNVCRRSMAYCTIE